MNFFLSVILSFYHFLSVIFSFCFSFFMLSFLSVFFLFIFHFCFYASVFLSFFLSFLFIYFFLSFLFFSFLLSIFHVFSFFSSFLYFLLYLCLLSLYFEEKNTVILIGVTFSETCMTWTMKAVHRLQMNVLKTLRSPSLCQQLIDPVACATMNCWRPQLLQKWIKLDPPLNDIFIFYFIFFYWGPSGYLHTLPSFLTFYLSFSLS